MSTDASGETFGFAGGAAPVRFEDFAGGSEEKTLERPGSSNGEDAGSVSLLLIRHVAERVRGLHQRADKAESEAQQIARNAVAAMKTAEDRAHAAEAAAAAMLERAGRAEERARVAEATTAAAVQRAEQAEEQLRLRKLQDDESETRSRGVDDWLKQAHLSLRQIGVRRLDDSGA